MHKGHIDKMWPFLRLRFVKDRRALGEARKRTKGCVVGKG